MICVRFAGPALVLLTLTSCSSDSKVDEDVPSQAERQHEWWEDVFRLGGGLNAIISAKKGSYDNGLADTPGSLRLITGHRNGAAHNPIGAYIAGSIDTREEAMFSAEQAVGLVSYTCRTTADFVASDKERGTIEDEAAELAGITWDVYGDR